MKRKLTREQCLTILRLPPRTNLVAHAKRLNVHVAFVRHIRYKCRWMLRSEDRKEVTL